jgi:formylglycine-generating enzyme required for sulfatase activity/class 3 adenylate cyclase
MPKESSTHLTSGMRRLTAVMSADIVAYSRHMGMDEEGTHARLTRYRRDVVEPTVAEHHGHIVKHLGDGFLAVFDSPLEATRCAIVIQQNIGARNTALPKAAWLQYRIGINLGDVIDQDDDIYGDGVNIAARLQSTAEPGGVNISGGVYEQVKNKLVCGYRSLGDEKLKNITDPVRIYQVLPDPAAVAHARPFGRALRLAIPVLGLCGIAFAGGLMMANRSSGPEQRAPEVSARGTPPASASGAAGAQAISAFLQPLPEPEPPHIPASPALAPPNAPASPGAQAAPERPSGASAGQQLAVAAPPASSPLQAAPASGSYRDCPFCPEMVRVPGGTFAMGSTEDSSERPVRQVAVRPFAIGRVPVTFRQWRACVLAKACTYDPAGEDELPVHNVSWDDAQLYVKWLSQATGRPYRLPSEAEWEYAARAGTTSAYWWGARMVSGAANCKGCVEPYNAARPVRTASFKPNGFGLFDMGGNVEEWVSDCWHPTYQGAPKTSASWDAPQCRESVLRGGSWKSEADEVRVSARAHYERAVRYPTHGFRVAVSD